MEALLQDLKHAIRLLVRHPVVSLTVVAVLALGIGGSTTIFSAVHALLLGPLPFPNGDRITTLQETVPARGMTGSVAGPNFVDWRDESATFEAMAAVEFRNTSLTGSGAPVRALYAGVSDGFFDVFTVEPVLGRTFAPEEVASGQPVVLLSHGIWQARFGADPGVLGRSVVVDGLPHQVVGVLPPSFRFSALHGALQPVEIVAPLDLAARFPERSWHALQVYGLLKRGTALEAAQGDLEAIAARIAEAYPEEQTGRSVLVSSLRERMTRGVRPSLVALACAVGLFLLIACANAAGLLIAWGAQRAPEFAARMALGATPARLVRQLLTESALLAAAGAAAGLLLSLWGIDLLRFGLLRDLSRVVPVGLDLGVLAFSLGVSATTVLLFGLWPAIAATKTDLRAGLEAGAARSTSDRRGVMARRILVVAELAISTILLVGAGLVARNVVTLQAVYPGFEAHDLVTFRVALPNTSYPDAADLQRFHEDLLGRLEGVPGVDGAGIMSFRPFSTANTNGSFQIVGRPPWSPGEGPDTEFQVVSPSIFRTMEIPLVAGRGLEDADRSDTPTVAVINRTMAERFWPEGNAVGEHLQIGWASDEPLEIVGVVGDVARWSLDRDDVPTTYLSYRQAPAQEVSVLVRSSVDVAPLRRTLAAVVTEVDPGLPIFRVETMEEVIASSLADRRFNGILLGVFSALALALAATGIYGLIAHQVRQRRREVGIRMALGATPGAIRALFLREALVLVALGLALGIGGSLGLGRILESLLYGMSPRDGATLVVVGGVLVAVSVAAVYLPAQRASCAEPMAALRCD